MLTAHALPTSLDGVDVDAVVMATAADKKRSSEGGVPFVLIDGPGQVRTGCQVEPRAVIAAVRELAA
jgi:3-dehydroquinate synthetase